ncbi:gene transfer agent family protein [Brevundimonas sp. CEF1]|uniref:gene transfer agent family protein n=1 Tax=Brevundimonas sp. CEF1 TaxID=3442642 RepID=UPI003F5122C7
MGLKTEVRIDFAGERRSFDLSPIGCVRRLQDACDAGPNHIRMRLLDGTWLEGDLRETLIQGLVGGGMTQRDAQALIEKWVDPEPKTQFVPLAQAIILAWLVGAEDEDLGEGTGEGESPILSPEAGSASPASTAPASAS